MTRLIWLWLGVLAPRLVVAEVTAASDPARLNRHLSAYCAGRLAPPKGLLVPGEGEYHGYPAVILILNQVMRRADDFRERVINRTLNLLTWAHDLAMVEGVPQQTFERRLLRKQLNTLFRVFRPGDERREAIMALLEATQLWNSAQVRHLADRAGDADPSSARYHAGVLMRMRPWSPDDQRAIAGVVRRRVRRLRTAEQWGLLGLTELAMEEDAAHALRLGAWSFASWDPLNPLLDEGHPVRELVEEIAATYDGDDDFPNNAFDRAWDLSELEGDLSTPWSERQRFFHVIHPKADEVDEAGDPAPPPTPAPLVKTRRRFKSRYPHRGNVFFPRFGQTAPVSDRK